MTGFVEVMLVAMTAQLAVLPGEKVQFLISGLATHYSPLIVVSAAGTAFAGWTALEIYFGSAVRGALSPWLLDAITAGLFLLFAVLLVRSAPASGDTPAQTDGGTSAVEELELPVIGRVPNYLGGFVPIFLLMAAGEFGDKTQLVTINLAIQYGAHPGIWVGEMLAIVPVSVLNAVAFHRFAHTIDRRKAHLFGAGVFAFFGLDTMLSLTVDFSIWETLVTALADLLLGVV